MRSSSSSKVLCIFVLLALLLSCTGFKANSYHIQNAQALTQTDLEYMQNLPNPLKTQEERALLIKWYCKLRDLQLARDTVSIATIEETTGLSENSIEKLSILYGKLEETLLRVNLRLVLKVALQQLDKGLDLDDLMHEGIRGLKRAAEKFDNSKGVCFSTYAYPWIQVYIKAALASAPPITLPRHVYQLLTKVQAVKSRFYLSTGKQPTDEELAKEMGVTMERFQIVRKAMALAERSNVAKNDDSPVPYHESTWEATTSNESNEDLIDRVVSNNLQPPQTSSNTVISQTMYEVLQILPKEENEAIISRLMAPNRGESDKQSDDQNSDNKKGNEGSDNSGSFESKSEKEEQKTHYRKGMRRLRRNVKSGKVLQSTDSLFLSL